MKRQKKFTYQFTSTCFKEAVNEGIHLVFITRDTDKSNKEDKKESDVYIFIKSNLVCETYKKVSRECGALESIQPVQLVYLFSCRIY
jgi:hypothetical protein